jgi:hypothetical protein
MPKPEKRIMKFEHVVGDGFVVAGKKAGERISMSDVDSPIVFGALVASGRVVAVEAVSSATIEVIPEALKEGQDNG